MVEFRNFRPSADNVPIAWPDRVIRSKRPVRKRLEFLLKKVDERGLFVGLSLTLYT